MIKDVDEQLKRINQLKWHLNKFIIKYIKYSIKNI